MLKSVVNNIQEDSNANDKFTDDQAAAILQNAYRKHIKKRQLGNVIEFSPELIGFIRHFYDKWKSKSIYQVLLQYRAQKFQELYNLSQQVHLYNQNVFNNLQHSDNIDLKLIDSKANVKTWLSEKKQSVSKLPFRLDEVPYFDTSYMCEPSTVAEQSGEIEDESWDAPYRWRDSVSLQIASSMVNSSNSSNEHKNQLIEIPFVRSISDPIVNLSEDLRDFEQEPNLETSYSSNNSLHEANNIVASADNDFEYIKPTVREKVKTEFTNPIAELETIGKTNSPNSEDDPPFNFQGILRKTNYQRKSIKREQDPEPFYSLKKHETRSNINENGITKTPSIDYNKKNVVANGKDDALPLTEITPGIFMQGFMVEL